MIWLIVCSLFSVIAGFLLTLQQVHFTIVVNGRNDSGRGNSIRDSIINGFYRKPKQFLEATVLAKLFFFAILIASSFNWLFIGTSSIPYSFEWVIIIFYIFLGTFIYLFFCEFLPRLFYNYTNKYLTIKRLIVPITIVYVFFYPWVSLFSHLGDFLFKKVKENKEKKDSDSDWGEALFDISVHEQFKRENNNPEKESERQILQNVIDFSSAKVRDTMIPRTEIVAINLENSNIGELKEKFSQSGHSRIIVYKENIDHVVGYIHTLEMFEELADWEKYIKEVPFVPETMSAQDLMKDLMQKQKNIAVVVDEFGGTAGIITLEDLVEEIFGEIEDEHDKKRLIERKINDREFVFAGRMEIDYINEKYSLDLPASEDYITLAGYLIYENQRFPKLNQVISVGNKSFTILKMSPTKVELVKVVVNG